MNKFLDYARQMMRQKYAASKNKTANNYASAIRALQRFLNFEGRDDLPFSLLDADLIQRFETYLLIERQVTRNTSSFYMRSLHAVWNEAVRQGLVPKVSDPFRCVYTGVDRTRPRPAVEGNIQLIIEANLDDKPTLAFARDIFLFSLLGHGIAFIDMAKLRKRDVVRGRLSYRRSKTGAHLCVRLSEPMTNIIRRWNVPASPLLLPLVPLPFTQSAYDNALHRYNRNLQRLAEHLDIHEHITSYTARHSWASEAYRLQVPISVISTCMGHTSEQTTRIYLSSLDTEFIDSQAARVEDFFLARKQKK